MKGIILAAGRGSRLQPFSFTQPKTMLPIANKPVLEYCIENLKMANIKEIGIVINSLQYEIIDYINSRYDQSVNVTFIFQHEAKGIAHAVKQAEEYINNEPFLLLLGDNLIKESLITLRNHLDDPEITSSVMLAKVDSPKDFGIAEIRNQEIITLEEKPPFPKSNLAVIGAYAFRPSIFKAIDQITTSARGELEITDAIQWLIDNGHTISHTITTKPYTDVGTTERWLLANHWILSEITATTSKLNLNDVNIKDSTIIPPVVIGAGCTVTNSTVGPFVTIGKSSSIENCKIQNSILLEETVIKDCSCTFTDAIFGRETYIKGLNSNLANCILGDKTKIILN
ncbi:sugar phosphate nucleotidyltransferase [Fictibacillus sp. b24]|uniref:sugar phosphate nucleotidyltransferase n=1 Tax=Fictibacillus sp. b24 TaxID=3055863 RepID=UPI0025A21DA8|nr:sugar phosphate nucleotidyltransferase [Fictibacillus sp. b24]MDM5316747.1 sugar phosphate nucleotidyltransferase [Fictibacillus sp. b24]